MWVQIALLACSRVQSSRTAKKLTTSLVRLRVPTGNFMFQACIGVKNCNCRWAPPKSAVVDSDINNRQWTLFGTWNGSGRMSRDCSGQGFKDRPVRSYSLRSKMDKSIAHHQSDVGIQSFPSHLIFQFCIGRMDRVLRTIIVVNVNVFPEIGLKRLRSL